MSVVHYAKIKIEARFQVDQYFIGRIFYMTRILFVCHGNICRSVSAQYIMQDIAERNGAAEKA